MDNATGKERDVSEPVIRVRAIQLDVVEWYELFSLRQRDDHMVKGINRKDIVDAVDVARDISNNKDEANFLAHRGSVIASFKLK